MKPSNNTTVTVALALILIIGLFVLSWMVFIPNYSDNKTQLDSLNSEIDGAKAKMDSLDSSKSQLAGIDDIVKQIFVAVPNDLDEEDLLPELEAIAAKNGLILPSISISIGVAGQSSSSPTSGFTAGTPLSISFSVNGTFEQLQGFVSGLESSVKFMNIKTMSYSVNDQDKTIGLSLQVEAYSRYVAETVTTP